MSLKQQHENAILSSYNNHLGAMTADQTSYQHNNQNDIVTSEWTNNQVPGQYQYDPSQAQGMEEEMYGMEMDDMDIDQIDDAAADYLQANANIDMYRQIDPR